ncbi:hypothetical protein [Eubacterium sp. AB3007]|uniref:hypothetical protein n=1 Tax=Eubacterium sp. AB3007 TaxID=1392487 RepID=UPI0004890232|nr:hypothetical protein [Eubacterium sp. AB3007]MBQ1470848.1 hypothetical protein [Eubacterium sp.]
MTDRKLAIQKSKDIVWNNMDDYKIYLSKYINDSRNSAEALDYARYETDCMSDIFYDSLNDAVWTDWEEIDRNTLLSRIYKILENIDASELKHKRSFRTPGYACVVIANAISGIPLTSPQIARLLSFDAQIHAYFQKAYTELDTELRSDE